MRPRSIVQYELIYVASMVIGLATLVFMWPLMTGQLAGTPLSPATVQAIVIGATLFGLAINLLLLWLTARKGSEVARVFVAIFFGLGIASGLWGLAIGSAYGLAAVFRIVQIVLEALMLYLIFVPADAKAWFARTRRGG